MGHLVLYMQIDSIESSLKAKADCKPSIDDTTTRLLETGALKKEK